MLKSISLLALSLLAATPAIAAAPNCNHYVNASMKGDGARAPLIPCRTLLPRGEKEVRGGASPQFFLLPSWESSERSCKGPVDLCSEERPSGFACGLLPEGRMRG